MSGGGAEFEYPDEAGYPDGLKTTLWYMSNQRPYFPKPDQIALHVGIGILLNHQRGRGVAQIQEERTVLRLRFGDEGRDLPGNLGEAFAGRVDAQFRAGHKLRRHPADGGERPGHCRVRQIFPK